MKQTFGPRHGEQSRDTHRPRRLAKDGHVAGIATKLRDVLLHPLQRRHLIKQAEVSRSGVRRIEVAEFKKAEGAESLDERD